MTLIDDGKLIESEFGVTRRKNTYNVILFCFVRVGKTWFLMQFGVNKRGLIFKDNKIAQPVIFMKKASEEWERGLFVTCRRCTSVTRKMHSFSASQNCLIVIRYVIILIFLCILVLTHCSSILLFKAFSHIFFLKDEIEHLFLSLFCWEVYLFYYDVCFSSVIWS